MFNGVIRPLEAEDMESVEKIFDLYWSDDFRTHLSDRLRSSDKGFTWFVAEEDGEVVGVAAMRPAPDRMKEYAKAEEVAEFYVAAVKYKGRGVGTSLREALIQEAKKDGYEEAVFFSGDTHQDAWAFHDNSAFKRVGHAVAPDGESGQIWLMGMR